MKEYLPRVLDYVIEEYLEAFGAVQIVGPKWCGKTTTAMQLSKSVLDLQDEDVMVRSIELGQIQPSILLEGAKPRLLDEWQVIPGLWNSVRKSVDRIGEPGLYLLTGSVNAKLRSTDHTGIGRIGTIRMRTMSLFESGDSTGTVSLGDLFNGIESISGSSDHRLEDIARFVLRGGWPSNVGREDKDALRLVADYCQKLTVSEVNLAEGPYRDKDRMRAVLRSLSRRISAPLNKTGIIDDVCKEGEPRMAPVTLDNYLSALRDVNVLEEVSAWNPNLVSATSTRTTPTIQLCDPAIAAYFLGAGQEDLSKDVITLGLLFEALVVRDVRVYASKYDADVRHYRDKDGLEVDIIVHMPNGKWAGIEVKLGVNAVDSAAKNLLKLKNKVNGEHAGPPLFLAVITGFGYAYTRPDGVHVIPIGCFRD